MKKKLQSILVVALALITTVSYAQDWGIDSRTRIDMSGEGEKMSTDQRVTLGTTWGGSDWGIHLSTDVHYTLIDANTSARPTIGVYEAYATTGLFGFANLTVGRKALEYGSGVWVSKNDWADNINSERNTVEGMIFDIDNDFVDLDLGISQRDNGDGSEMLDIMWLNASKSSGDWGINLLYSDVSNMTQVAMNDTTVVGVSTEAQAMGLDFSYTAMGGALDLAVSYNTLTVGDTEMDMTDISGTYIVNDDMTVTAGRASYGEYGFDDFLGLGNRGAAGTNSWISHGNIGHLNPNDENMYIGASYNMGSFSLGATMHTVSNTEIDSYERTASEISIGYNLNDNASLSYKMVADNEGGEEDVNYNWLTLTITP
jgi:hypothetical protein